MATIEEKGIFTYVDENGSHHLLYPVTTMDAVDGLQEALDAVEQKKFQFTNISVDASKFVSNSTNENFPFRASVALSGVTSSMIPEVIFNLADATSGVFAPVADSYDGGVYIYASEKPAATVTIPTILLWKGDTQ